MVHFNWTQLIPEVGHEYGHVATMVISSAVLIVLGIVARISLGHGEKALAPAKSIGLRAIFESIVEFIASISEMVIGEEGREYVPFFATIFSFVFFCNLMGLLPGFTPPTDNLNTTLALGLFIFVCYNFFGLRANGLGYLKHFLGPLLALAPIMLVLEIISHLARPLSLGLRLQGNMVGDHTVLGLFLDLAPYYLVPVIFYALGLFVCFMQAFVFTMLSMIYVSMAIAHDH
jgi:F-type H+-transporting ATPase subunit a